MNVRNQPRQAGSQASRVWEVGAMALIGLSLAAAAAATDHDLMPAPAQLEWAAGELVVTESFRVTSAGVADDRIDSAMRRTRGRLESLLGRSLEPAGEPVLTLVAAAPGLPVQSPAEDESYRLEVTPQGARLEAPSPLGILHGLETFLQLASRKGEGLVVPSVTIEDRPRFPWRGLLLDPSRRFQPLEVLKRTLDGMAAVKLNVFHFHLSEDQGFRIESRRFPRLHELGSDGLYFTQDQVRELIAYARDRGIRVVPEFDVPGHSTSWLVGHPELGSVPGPFSLVRRWGIFDNNLNPSNEEVYALLDGFLGEMAALFPDPYLHIGGDEVTPRQWNQNPGILEFMFQNDLRNARDLQAHFNRRVSTILERHGKRMMGWDEILHPDLPGDIVVHSWRGPAALAEAARHGYDGVLSNGYYLDHMLPASSHYAVDPLRADSKLTAEQRRHVLGGEACMWGEFVTPETIDSRIWPRAAAIAERLWSPAEVRDEEDMYRRLAVQSRRLTALGLTHDTHYAVMLKRLTGGEPIEPLRVLADLVQPVKLYARGQMRAYTSDLPLERLVDAARPESAAARSFRSSLDRCLRQSVEDRVDSELRATLTGWRDNHAVLDPILAASPLAAEARTLSRDLSGIAATGLEALDHLRAGKAPPTAWVEAAKRSLDRAGQPWAEVELAVVPSLRKLVLGAERVEDLARLSPEEWEAELEAAVGKASGSRPSH
jgi:hexosaminidase